MTGDFNNRIGTVPDILVEDKKGQFLPGWYKLDTVTSNINDSICKRI